MDSFNKIMALDLDNLEDKDFSYSLNYCLKLNDLEKEKVFLENYKIAIKKHLDILLKNVDVYPILDSYDNNIYRIDRLLFLAYSLYGFDCLDEFDFKKGNSDVSFKDYKNSLKRYSSRVHNGLISDINLVRDIKLYNIKKGVLTKYSDVNEDVLKEAFYTFFTFDNFLDRDNYLDRKNNFIKVNSIDQETLRDYAIVYGVKVLNISILEINRMLNSLHNVIKHNNTISIFRLEILVLSIEKENDFNKIKKIVHQNHLSLHIIDYFFEWDKHYEDDFNKKLIYSKVNNAIKSLEEEYKYIHYSVVLSKLEKTEDLKEISLLVSNNVDMLNEDVIDRFISIYRMTLTEEEKKILKDNLINKINYVKEIIKKDADNIRAAKRRSKQQSIVDSVNFSLFLNDEIISTTDFCQLMGISKNEFYEGLEYLEEVNNELYTKIKDKIDSLKSKRFAVLANKVNIIVDSIVNGVKEEDNSIRPFQILDYFLMTNLDFSSFLNIYTSSNSVNTKDLYIIRKFFKENNLSNKLDIKTELTGKTIFMINNSPYEVKEEEKKEVMTFLKSHNIPFYIKVYKQALKRHVVNHSLIKSSDKTIKKVDQ